MSGEPPTSTRTAKSWFVEFKEENVKLRQRRLGVTRTDRCVKSSKFGTILTLCALFLGFGVNDPCLAQIYKWKDESGKWHFSDKPPPDKNKAEVVGSGKAKGKAPVGSDIATALEEKIEPRSPIERATMAVVSIETPLVTGSGFFVTEDGYLLTNRHVVRPTTSTGWKAADESIEELREAYESAEEELKKERKTLKLMDTRLKAYRKEIDAEPSSSRRRVMQEEYDVYHEHYRDRRKTYLEVKRDFDQKRRAFDSAKLEFSRKSSAATLATNFKITLKDDTTLTARLVGVSREQDLALLKVDGYKTPYIVRGKPRALVQGNPIFAIGSPLGLEDSVTSGVVTRVKKEFVMTDAKVLPGSSGGPLVNPEGEVVGVISAKYAESIAAEGFGVAIRIDVAGREFARELGAGGG